MTVISGTLVLGIALGAVVNFIANRGADRERVRRAACDLERENEVRGQAAVGEERLLELHRQATRQ